MKAILMAMAAMMMAGCGSEKLEKANQEVLVGQIWLLNEAEDPFEEPTFDRVRIEAVKDDYIKFSGVMLSGTLKGQRLDASCSIRALKRDCHLLTDTNDVVSAEIKEKPAKQPRPLPDGFEIGVDGQGKYRFKEANCDVNILSYTTREEAVDAAWSRVEYKQNKSLREQWTTEQEQSK